MKKALCVLYYIIMALPIPVSMVTWIGTIMSVANIGEMDMEGASFLGIISAFVAIWSMLLAGTYLISYVISLIRMIIVKKVTFSMFLPIIHIVITGIFMFVWFGGYSVLENENGNSLIKLLIIMFLVAIVGSIALILGRVVLAMVKAIKNSAPASKKVIFYTIGAIIIAAASWVLNFGLLRFLLTILMIPMIHGILFLFANIYFAKYTEKLPNMKKLNLLFIITYLIAYVFLPDVDEMVFFGLIHNNIISYIASFISRIAGVGHIVLFILQIVKIKEIKKSISENNELQP